MERRTVQCGADGVRHRRFGQHVGNDRGKKRLSVARDLVERFPENTRTGVVRFADGVTDLTGGLTDAQTAKNALADANFYDSGGTSMYLAVRRALNMFQGDDDTTLRNIIVLFRRRDLRHATA